jgi:hypothetical protein
MDRFSALLAHRIWWLAGYSLLAFAVVAGLRFQKGANIRDLGDVGWTIAAGAVLTIGTVSIGLLGALAVKPLLGARLSFFTVLQCISSAILLLLSAAMIIQA